MRYDPPVMAAARLIAIALLVAGCASHRAGARAETAFGAEAARRGLWREARWRFERAVRLDPTLAAAWNDVAVAREAEGDIALARAAYLRAAELAPGNDDVEENLRRFHARHPGASKDGS